MKTIRIIVLLFIVQLILSISIPHVFGQLSKAIKYQAILRDSEGNIIANQLVSLKISILQGSASGSVIYSEDHHKTTNQFGLVNLEIGNGNVLIGDYDTINWGSDNHFVQMEIDETGGTAFRLMGISQLLSVPYALHAEDVRNKDDADADPENEIQLLSISNDTLFLSDGGFAKLPAGLSGSFNDLSDVPVNLDTDATDDFSGNYTDLTNQPVIPSKVGDLVNDAGYLSIEVDGSTINEIQLLSISNDTIFLSDGGFAKLPPGFSGSFNDLSSVPANLDTDAADDFSGNYTDLTNQPVIPSKIGDLVNDAGYLSVEVDGSTINEIQILSISNDTIFLSDGGFVKLPSGFSNSFNDLSDVPANLDTDSTDDFSGIYTDLTNQPIIPTKLGDLVNDAGFLSTEVDGSTINEIQILSISNDTLFLSDGGFAKLPPGFSGSFDDLSSVPANLDTDAMDDFSGNYADLTNQPTIPSKVGELVNDVGYLSIEVDGSTLNEIQVLSISNDTIYLSDGGFAKLPSGFSNSFNDLSDVPANLDTDATDDFSGDYTDLTNQPVIPSKVGDLVNNAGYLSIEVDGSTINEIQVLSILKDTIFLSEGGFAKLPAGFSGSFDDLSDVPVNLDTDATDDFSGDYTDLTNQPVIPSKIGDLVNDAGYLSVEVDGSTINEIQILSISNDTIFLSDGGFTKLPAGFSGSFDDLSDVPVNLDTDVSDDFSGIYTDLSNQPMIPSKVGDLVNDAGFLSIEVDGSTINEIQILSISNDTIYLSDGGFAKLPAGFSGSFDDLSDVPANLDTDATDDFSGNYSDLTNQPTIPSKVGELVNDVGFLSIEVDGSTINELQILSISNDTLFLSDGGFAKLPAGFSSSFEDLSDVPVNLDTDATDDFSGNYADLTNQPTVPTKVSDLANDAGYLKNGIMENIGIGGDPWASERLRVVGSNSSIGGANSVAVSGDQTGTGINNGVSGTGTDGITNYGVSGRASGDNAHWPGYSPFDGNYGVRGDASGMSSNNYGIYGIVESENDNSNSNYGVYGCVMNSSGWSNNYGVYGALGTFNGGASGYAIYGDARNDDEAYYGYAGWFEGDVHVNGQLTKSSGSFKIDHPTDPANKFLVHSFVESPEMLNIYRGTVTTDSKGEAVALLPPYFEAENVNFDYQLTIIGQFAQAMVAKEISDNKFIIKTDKPDVKVSWLVIGARNDEYAKKHPIIAEQEKNEREKGKYLNPDLFGKGVEMSIGN